MAQGMAGLALALATCLGLRALVGAPLLGPPGPGRLLTLGLDLMAPVIGLILFTLPTARPVLAGLAILCLGFGLGVVDRVKRHILDEPVVFADRAEFLELVRHPRLYLAFVGWLPLTLGALAVAGAVAVMIWAEPPLWRMNLGQAALIAGGAALIGRALFVIPTAPAIMEPLARLYAGLQPAREPKADAARFGILAAAHMQATLARVERPTRQRAAQARPWPAVPADAGPIVVVQGESFVDAGRLHSELADLLPHFARLREEAVAHGRLAVPCWGANTIRSELAVMAGLSTDDIGLDRFNPYERFAHVPLPSIASAARAGGYRTICVHPYNRDFYLRDRVMPLLGFDEFIGIEGFAGAPTFGPYVSDVALAERGADLIRRHGPKVMLFLITMENHGPWDAAHDVVAPAPLPEEWRGLPDAAAVGRWLAHLRSTDAMIPILREAMGEAGWLLLYGDHQPSLAGPFRALGAADRRTDYALWSPNASPGGRADRAAEELAFALLAAASTRTLSHDNLRSC